MGQKYSKVVFKLSSRSLSLHAEFMRKIVDGQSVGKLPLGAIGWFHVEPELLFRT